MTTTTVLTVHHRGALRRPTPDLLRLLLPLLELEEWEEDWDAWPTETDPADPDARATSTALSPVVREVAA